MLDRFKEAIKTPDSIGVVQSVTVSSMSVSTSSGPRSFGVLPGVIVGDRVAISGDLVTLMHRREGLIKYEV